MSLENQVASLTAATTNLLEAVNVSKATLDQRVTDAAAQATASTQQATAAAASATAANTSAGQSAGSAAQALAIFGSTAAQQAAVTAAQNAASVAAGHAASASSVVQQDLSGVNAAALHRSPNAVTAMFIYDTSKDSDGGAWTEKCQHTSWYNEPINGKWLGPQASEAAARAVSGATTGDYFQRTSDGLFYRLNSSSGITETFRGNKRDFPRLAAVVAEANSVTIYDLTEPGRPMWMRLVQAGTTTGRQFWAAGVASTSSSALNGRVLVGLTNATHSNAGLISLDFAADNGVRLVHTTGFGHAGAVYGGLANRNSAALAVSGQYPVLVAGPVNAVAMTVLPNAPIDPVTGLKVPTIAVHTAGGVSIIRHDGTVTSSAFSANTSDGVAFVQPDLLAYTRFANFWGFQSVRVSEIVGPTFSPSFAGGNTATQGLGPVNLRGIRRGTFVSNRPAATGTAITLAKTGDTVTPGGLLRADVANAFNTGYLFGDIRRAYLADVGAGSVSAGPELVTNGTFDSGLSGWTARIDGDGGMAWNPAGRIEVTGGASTSNGGYQDLTLVPGRTYLVTAATTGDGRLAAYRGTAFSDPMVATSDGSGGVRLIFTAGATTQRLFVYAAAGGTGTLDNISVKEVVADRSYKAQGANITGTLTKTPVAEGAQLVAWSNWSAVNNVQEPYSADLDFGTGEWTASAWVNVPATLPVANFPVIGSNVLPSSTFNASDWTVTGGDATHIATFSGGTLRYQSDTTTPQLSVSAPGNSLVAERMYRITVTCSAWVSGSVKMFEGVYGQLVVGGVGTFTAVMRTNLTGFSITRNSSNVDLTLSSIEIREVSPALLADRSAATGPAVKMAVDGAGRLIATAFDGTTTRTVTTTQAYNTGTWLKARANYRAGRLSISVNGAEVAATNGASLATLNNSNAVLTIGNSFSLDAPFPGSIALVKFSAGVPTAEQSLFMYEQEKQMFREGAQVCLPDAGSLVDLTYDDATDKWIAISATNESEFSGLVRTSVTPVPAGSYIKATATSGVQLLARSTTTPGVDLTMPAYGLRSELVKRAEAAAKMKQDTLVFDFDTIGFTAAMTTGSNQITASSITGTPFVGMVVTGTGIPANTTIAGINGTTYTLSANATATGSNAVGQAGFDLPTGYTARVVYSAGQQRREGSTRDYTRLFDGFREQIRFAVTPGASTWVQIHAVKEIA